MCKEKTFESGYMTLRERMSFICFVCYVNTKVFHFICFSFLLFIYMFPFCLHATSALYKPISILLFIIYFSFFIIKRF